MKKLLTVMAFSVGLFANAQTGNLFKPVKEVALRTPSVPIVVSDPHFSIWSPYDKLMEGSTEHWTTAKKPLVGALRVDGKVYRFLGKDQVALIPIAPMTNVERWEAAYTNSQPANGWQEFQFDDSSWKKGKAAFGSRDMPRVRTEWKGDNTDIYIRRTFEINDLDLTENIFLIYSHDDVFELYLNGEKLVATDLVWKNNVNLKLSDEAKKKLRNGKNVIAAHCHNTTGGSYVDFGLYREKKNAVTFENEAVQKSVDVLATSSYYTFTCGPVELDVVFTAPQLIDDLDLLSTPINYISYRVRPLDKKEHDVQFYIETTPVLAVNETTQPTIARTLSKNGISYVEAGTINQPICDRKGDLICADWGYVYLGSVNGAGKSISLGDYSGMKEAFVKNGTLASSKTKWVTRREENTPAMAYVHNFGTVTKDGKDGFLMIGYDDIYSIEYMYEKRMGYWKHDGKVTIFDAFEKLRDNCEEIRDLAIIDLLYSTGIRVGELVNLNIDDIDLEGRECVVYGKGDKERKVYFDAKAKVHLKEYIERRTDQNEALFVTLDAPHDRLKISGVEIRLRKLGRRLDLERIHPHKFRRTMATRAIDKGMPIEQVQKILGHSQIDTTMQYAMVNQSNVKTSHQKYMG